MGTYTFLLIGKSGNGKSSTGNSILAQKKVFVPRSGSQTTHGDVRVESLVVGSNKITVVDGPGIGDAKGVEQTIKDTNKVFQFPECSDGFDAILIVLKYGERFTKQEQDSIRMMKGILGKDFVKTHGIVVFTYGDSFECDNEDDQFTFMDWCEEQTGDIKKIFKECEYRCLIFNNRADETGAEGQRHTLFENVDRLKQSAEWKKNGKYGRKDYDEAEESREELIEVSKLPILQQEHKDTIKRFQMELDKDDNDKSSLLSLKKKVEDYKKSLQDKKCQEFNKFLITEIEITESIIKTRLKKIEAQQQMFALQHERQDNKRHAHTEKHTQSRSQMSGTQAYITNDGNGQNASISSSVHSRTKERSGNKAVAKRRKSKHSCYCSIS